MTYLETCGHGIVYLYTALDMYDLLETCGHGIVYLYTALDMYDLP